MRNRRVMIALTVALGAAVVANDRPVRADLSVSTDDSLNSVAGVVGPQGYGMATGNFNGDEYDDLVVHNRSDTIDGEDSAGSISLVWGTADGLDWAGAEVVHQDTPGVDGVAEAGDWFGEALAVGNFNGDCCDDLAVGTKREALEGNSVPNSGWVQIFSGTPSGLDLDDRSFDQETPGGWPATNEELDWFGGALASADFDDDGYDDLAIGVPYEDLGSGADAVERAGAVVVVFGTGAGIDIGEHSVILPEPRVEQGQFGTELSALRVADGDDVLVVTSLRPIPNGEFMNFTGLDAGASVPEPVLLTDAVRDAVSFPTGQIGWRHTPGDFDGDGHDDLITRVSNSTPVPEGEKRRSDVAAVLMGPFGPDGASAIDVLGVDSPGVDKTSFPGPEPYYAIGSTSATGDFDADGYDDVVTAVFAPSCQPTCAFGLTFYGSPTGLTGTGSHVVPFETYSVTAGDFDADGYSDYVAAAFGANLTSVFHRDGTLTPGEIAFGRTTNSWEHAGRVDVELYRFGNDEGPMTVRVRTVANGEATPGVDYTPIDVELTWADRDSTSQWISVPIALDGEADRGERFTLELSYDDPATGDRIVRDRTVGIFDGDIESIPPARLLETRSNGLTIDGAFRGVGQIPAGGQLKVRVAGRGGVPVGAVAAALNFTAITPDRPGFFTVYPCTDQVPTASTLNYLPGEIVANGTIAKLDDNGDVCIYSLGAADAVVDVNGFVPDGSGVVAVDPGRVLDTRSGEPTIDGLDSGGGRLKSASRREVQITGRAGVADDAATVLLNVTPVAPEGPGFVTVFPCSADVPLASNVNYEAGAIVANGVVTQLSDKGTVCLYTLASTDLVVDVVGYSTNRSLLPTFEPVRVFDSRRGETTFDGQFAGQGRLRAGVPVEIPLGDRGIETGGDESLGAFVNVIAVDPVAAGFITAYPCGPDVPLASNVNYKAGAIVANNAFVALTDDESLCLVSLVDTHAVVDVSGFSVLT